MILEMPYPLGEDEQGGKHMKQAHKPPKLCFMASSGGHFEQIRMMRPLMEKYPSFVMTEKTAYRAEIPGQKTYYLHQVNRMEPISYLWQLGNAFRSLWVFWKEKPDVVITTGVLAVIPMCLICKLAGKKLIYIESFAKISSPTMTGSFLHRFADRFYVQWEPMLEVYPDAIYLGGIY